MKYRDIVDLLKKKNEILNELKGITQLQNELLKKSVFSEISDEFEISLNDKSELLSDIGAIDSLINKIKASAIESGGLDKEDSISDDALVHMKRIESTLQDLFVVEEQNKVLLKDMIAKTRDDNQKSKDTIKVSKSYNNMSKNNYVDQAFFFDQKSWHKK